MVDLSQQATERERRRDEELEKNPPADSFEKSVVDTWLNGTFDPSLTTAMNCLVDEIAAKRQQQSTQ